MEEFPKFEAGNLLRLIETSTVLLRPDSCSNFLFQDLNICDKVSSLDAEDDTKKTFTNATEN